MINMVLTCMLVLFKCLCTTYTIRYTATHVYIVRRASVYYDHVGLTYEAYTDPM